MYATCGGTTGKPSGVLSICMSLQAHGPSSLLSAAGALDTARERAVAEAVQKAVTSGTTVPSMASTLPAPSGEKWTITSS